MTSLVPSRNCFLTELMSLNALYSTYAFLGFVLVLTPFPWHFQAWNSGTCLFMIWVAIGCLLHFVNSIVWSNNIEIHSFIYGDIASKIIIGLEIGIPCSVLCISRRLFLIATVSQVTITRSEKIRAVLIDLAIGVGFPILIMALHYIIQGHRFDIYEGFGPWPSVVDMWPSYVILWMWPIIIGLISLTYSARSLYAFLRRRIEFQQYLSSNQSGMTFNRYFRLMALAVIDMTMLTPLAIYFMVLNLQVGLSPWISWSDTKWGFSRVDVIPTILIDPTFRNALLLNVWIVPTCGIIFFLFFGLAEESRRNYKRVVVAILSRLHLVPKKKQASVLPIRINISHDLASESSFKIDRISLSRSSFSHEASVPLPFPVVTVPDQPHHSVRTPFQTPPSHTDPSCPILPVNHGGSENHDHDTFVPNPIARPSYALTPSSERKFFNIELDVPRSPSIHDIAHV